MFSRGCCNDLLCNQVLSPTIHNKKGTRTFAGDIYRDVRRGSRLLTIATPIRAQQGTNSAVVVQPGAPGKPSRTLPPSTRPTLPALSVADVEFMQGMIVHHAQAVEMTALIASHTDNKELRSLGARISSSQSDEIKFMRRWLAARGKATSMTTPEMPGMDMSHEPMPLMPGMLTPQQMDALRRAQGSKFDRLFLTGMIQHHDGALTMVKDFSTLPAPARMPKYLTSPRMRTIRNGPRSGLCRPCLINSRLCLINKR